MSEYIDSPEAKVTLYEQLGVEISSLIAQRDKIKEELIEDYKAGVVCSNGIKQVSYKSVPRQDFDWKTAHAKGDISDEILARYAKTTMSPTFRLVKVEAEAEPVTDELRENLARSISNVAANLTVGQQVKA